MADHLAAGSGCFAFRSVSDGNGSIKCGKELENQRNCCIKSAQNQYLVGRITAGLHNGNWKSLKWKGKKGGKGCTPTKKLKKVKNFRRKKRIQKIELELGKKVIKSGVNGGNESGPYYREFRKPLDFYVN